MYTGLSGLVTSAYYISATFMILMGVYQVARGFVDEEFSRNKKDGLVFMVFGAVIMALAIGGGITFTDPLSSTYSYTTKEPYSIILRISGGLAPIAQAVILWGIVHYIMAFTKDGLEGKHKGVALMAVGILIGFFAQFADAILASIGM